MTIKYILTSIGSIFLLPSVAQSPRIKVDKKPNLVLVLLDDVGWGSLANNLPEYSPSELNQRSIEKYMKDYTVDQALEATEKAMPNLTRYCNQGVRFVNAYVTSNVSAPSRAGLLTSSYQERYGLYTNPEAAKGIPLDIKMMPQYIQQAGYATGVFGKWHNGGGTGKTKECSKGQNPLDRGFDTFYGFNFHGTQYYNSQIMYRDRENVQPQKFSTDEFTENAIEFIQKNQGKPKLIYLPYNALHAPLGADAPEKYSRLFNYGSKALNIYSSYMYAVDFGVEQIMQTLKSMGEYDNTMLVFLTDNGAPAGKPNVLPANGPFSGFKGTNFQGGYHVPMFIWYGNKIIQGKRCEQLVSSMDIFPTFMEIAGIPLPKDQKVDGVSLLPLLIGKTDKPVREYLVWMAQKSDYWEVDHADDHAVSQACYMVRKGNFVLRYNEEGDEYFLHEYASDRGEKLNVSEKYPEKLKELKMVFRNWFLTMKTPVSWPKAQWQNVQWWDQSIPPAPEIDRSLLGKGGTE